MVDNFSNNTDSLYAYSYGISGKFNLKIPLDDDIDIFVEALNFQGGQYKKIFDKRVNKFCTTLYTKTFKEVFDNYYEASLVKTPFGTCPFPAMKNVVTNFLISEDGMLPPYIPGGEKWKIHMRFIKDSEILGGYNLYILLRNEQTMIKF